MRIKWNEDVEDARQSNDAHHHICAEFAKEGFQKKFSTGASARAAVEDATAQRVVATTATEIKSGLKTNN